MTNSNLSLLMVLVGMNIAWGLSTLSSEHYILGSLQVLTSILVYWVFNREEKKEEAQ